HVSGWDDPRMPTLSGLRRRGFTPESIRELCDRVGVTKNASRSDVALLEYAVRDHLNKVAPRRMAVLDPLRVVIENYPEGEEDLLDAVNNPEDESAGTRKVPFGKVLYIEREDFREDPPKKFFRLAPGREVRLRYAYFITCNEVVKDDNGEIVELRCSYDPETRGGDAPDGRKVKATLHWVAAEHAVEAEARIYDRLFKVPAPGSGDRDFLDDLNPDSLEVKSPIYVEPNLDGFGVGDNLQFERLGYFCLDPDSDEGRSVFNRTTTLRDSWARIEKQMAQASKGKS
ncbi:MAG: glutamate--tRNA ligase family protein, partial [Acidobacteriota bacterium]